MNFQALAALKKQQKLFFGLFLLTAFMSGMKALGIFATGIFPWWSEAALSAFALIYAIVFTVKIRKEEAQGSGNKKTPVEEVEGGTPCVCCNKRITNEAEICPFCGWSQPR